MSHKLTRAVKMNDNPGPSTSGVRPVLPGPPRMVQMVTLPGRNYVLVNTPVFKMPHKPNVLKKSKQGFQPPVAKQAPVDCENINCNQPGQNNLFVRITAGTANQINLRVNTDHFQSINPNKYQFQPILEETPQNHKTIETESVFEGAVVSQDIIFKKDTAEGHEVDINGNKMFHDTLYSRNLGGSVHGKEDDDGELDVFDTIRNLKKKKQYKADYIACPLYYCNKYGPRCALDNHYILTHSERAINDARIFDNLNFLYGIRFKESLQPLKESSRPLKEPSYIKDLLKKS